MNRREFLKTTLATSAGLASGLLAGLRGAAASTATEPLRLHPQNPHYFLWQSKPAVLITAGEHYGAVLNLDFDYKRYLNELRAHRFNLTRIFSGAYREVPGSFNITGNTLAPAPGRFVCPWARSRTSGAGDGENKFDLRRWDDAYFARLKQFITEAGQHGVVVELVFFCTMYDDRVWNASPMNARNNINNVRKVNKYEIYSAEEPALLEIQLALVRKVVTELNAYPNLYYEVCNEPYERGGLTRSWNDQVIAAIVQAEAGLPNKHLIAQGFPPSSSAVTDLNPHISILNFHAAKPEAVRLNYHHNRAIAFDETGGSDRSDRKYRTEGWDWLMAGGAVYDHLDFSFTTDNPDGTAVPLPNGTPGGGGPDLRRQLRVLKDFIEQFDLIEMKPADGIIVRSRITGSDHRGKPSARAMEQADRVYLVYVNGGSAAELGLALPPGQYKAEWVNPKIGHVERTESFSHASGTRTLFAPSFAEDIALRVLRQRTG